MTPILVALLLLWTSESGRAQEFSGFSTRGQYIHAAKFMAGDYSCTLTVSGKGTCTRSGRAWEFALPPERPDTYIEVVYALADNDGLWLLLEFDDDEEGWGRVVRLQPGAPRPTWTHKLLSLNLVRPLRVGDDLFLAGLAFAARLDARTGRFVWTHVGRYKTGEMDAPQTLEVSGEHLVVRGTASGRPKTACFAITTGRVVACS